MTFEWKYHWIPKFRLFPLGVHEALEYLSGKSQKNTDSVNFDRGSINLAKYSKDWVSNYSKLLWIKGFKVHWVILLVPNHFKPTPSSRSSSSSASPNPKLTHYRGGIPLLMDTLLIRPAPLSILSSCWASSKKRKIKGLPSRKLLRKSRKEWKRLRGRPWRLRWLQRRCFPRAKGSQRRKFKGTRRTRCSLQQSHRKQPSQAAQQRIK